MANIPQPETRAIDFSLPNGDKQQVKLSDYHDTNIVLAFYPADWSPVCTSEMALIQETVDDIHSYHAEVLGISTDGSYSHKAWAEHQHITFPLLSDFWPHGAVAEQYGILNKNTGMSGRALFFIDESGLIRHIWVAEDPEIAPSINIIFKSLEQMEEAQKETTRHVI